MALVYFIDRNRGNDSNDGLTKDTAKQNPESIASISAGPGTTFLFESSSLWEPSIATRVLPTLGAWTGTQRNPVIIGMYDYASRSTGGARPRFRWNKKFAASEWSYDADLKCWYNTVDTPHLIGNTCLIRLGGTWAASRIDTAPTSEDPMAQKDGRYHNVNYRLYLYAPSNQDPTSYYGEVLLGITDQGFFPIGNARDWITIQDLDFEETGCGVLIFSNQTTHDTGVVARRIRGRNVSGLIKLGANTGGNVQAWVHDCEISGFGSTAIQGFTPVDDGFIHVEIFNNRISDGPHTYSQGAIYSQIRSPDCVPLIYGNHVSDCPWGTEDKTADGCAIYTETGANRNLVFGNLIERCYNAFSDNSGRLSIWTGNVVIDCYNAMRVTDQNDVGETDHRFLNNTCFCGNPNLLPRFGIGLPNSAWRAYKASGAAMALDVRNNLFVNIGPTSDRAAMLTPQVTWTGTLDGNIAVGYPYYARREYSPFTVESSTPHAITDPWPYLNRDGTLKVSPGTILDTLATDNPLAVGGEFIQGVRLFGGHRADPRMMPVGACEAVLARRAA